MILPLKINFLLVVLSLATATGVLLHDTKVDKATVGAVSQYFSQDKTVQSGEAHTHVEKTNLRALNTFVNARIQPRQQDDKRYLFDRFPGHGRYAFDNYNFPLSA